MVTGESITDIPGSSSARTGPVLSESAVQEHLMQISSKHACSRHPLFDALEEVTLTVDTAGDLLANYDAHASVLRRLLLKAAAIMPEPAVGFILENVRNEYGNGNYQKNHQEQLRDLAYSVGVSRSKFVGFRPESGIRRFIRLATSYYAPRAGLPGELYRPAVAAGAITATELLAIKEFIYLQKAFAKIGKKHHIWFHHVAIEAEHSEESLDLALYFAKHKRGLQSVEFGLLGVLDANVHLYDGLLATLNK